MAGAMDNAVNRQLLFDFRKTFPEVPETVIVSTLQQYGNNRNHCFDVLQRERQKYIYGPFESASGHVTNQLQGIRLKDDRGRGLSQPGIETRPPDPVFNTEYSYSTGMTHSRSEPHLLRETCHSPTHPGRPPEYSQTPTYYTDYSTAMQQYPAQLPPSTMYSNSGQGNYAQQDGRYQFAQQQQPPPYSMRPPSYNTNGANYNYSTAGASDARNPGMTQEWTSPGSSRGDPQRSSSPYVNYSTHGSPFPSPRQDPNRRTENRTNFTHATNLPPLHIDTSNAHTSRQFLGMANPLFAAHSPHNSRSQSPVVHNPMQMTLPQQPVSQQNYQSGIQNQHGQGAHTPGSEPGTPPVYFPNTNSATPNMFFHQTTPNRDVDKNPVSLLEASDTHEQLQQPIQPLIQSLSSSQSSLNDLEVRTSRSNSTDDVAFTQALVLHQKAQKEKLEKDSERYKAFCDELRAEVCAMEIEIAKTKSVRSQDRPSVVPNDLVQLRDTNRRLQIDIQLLYREVDSYETGQNQPSMNENFYSNMNSTGQIGTLRPPPSGVIESNQSVPRLPIHPQEQTTDDEQWACSACTFLNHPALDKCECCEFPRAVPHGQGPR